MLYNVRILIFRADRFHCFRKWTPRAKKCFKSTVKKISQTAASTAIKTAV